MTRISRLASLTSTTRHLTAILGLGAATLLLAGTAWADAEKSAGAAGAAEKSEIDSPEFWKQGRENLARLGDGFIVYEARRDGHWAIWTIKLDGTGQRQLTPAEAHRDQFCPQISPDGKSVSYLSMPMTDAPAEENKKSPLHVINPDGTGDHVVVDDARKYGNDWDRCVTWFTPERIAYVARDNNTYELDLKSGKSTLLISGGTGWLPNVTMTNVVTSFNTFSLFDAKTGAVTPMPHLGGCMPYFTRDGEWGFWMANMGGPIGKMRLSTRIWSPLLDPSIMPKERNYVYFPNVSSTQCLLSFSAVNHEKIRGGYGGYELSDYNVFIVQIDPSSLEVIGKPVRYSFDPVCNRFPDVYQPPMALGFVTNKVPLSVDYPGSGGDWNWDFGDGTSTKGASGKHEYKTPGLYIVSATQGDKSLHGEVRVLEAKMPKAMAAAMEGDKTVLVTFDEAVNLKAASIKLASGASIEKWTAAADSRSLKLSLAAKPAAADSVVIDNVSDLAQRPNKMETTKLPFEPKLWPATSEGVLFAWQTADKKNQIIDPGTGNPTAYRFIANDNGKLDENHALRPDGGSFRATDFGLQFGDAVRRSNAFSYEMTVIPEPATDEKARMLSSYYLYEKGNKLCLHIDASFMEICELPPSVVSHVLYTYTPGHFVCYVNGEQVFTSDKVNTDLRGVRGDAVTIGNNLDNQPWLGTAEGIAIFDHALSAGEAKAESEAYKKLRESRKVVAKVELEGTVVATSHAPKLAQITPYKQAMLVDEYAVNKVIAGKLEAKKIRVAHWVILNEQTLDVTQLPVGESVHMEVAPYAACPQLEGEYLADTLPEDFETPLYYAVSADWDHHVIPAWTAITGFVAKPQDPNIEHGKFDADAQYTQTFEPEGKTGLPDSYGKPEQWKLISPNNVNYFNLFDAFALNGSGCGYAVAYVKSPNARKALLNAGSIGGFKAWIDGKPVAAGHFGRYPFQGYERTEIELKEGWNEVLVKTTQLYAFWGFSCNLLSTDGTLIHDLSYSAVTPK